MATATEERIHIAQLLQCPICLNTFKKPKLLPCGHTYCTSCIQSHINSKLTPRETELRCFPCPVCRADTSPQNPEVDIDKWAESFPVNSMVISLLDVTVERDGENLCDLCLNRNRKNSATSYCRDCNRTMCGMCKECHGDIPSTNHHTVTDLNTKCEINEARPNLSFIEMCPIHSDKHIEFFCSDHYKLCCATCGFLEHRKCDNITSIKDMIKSYDLKTKSRELESILNNLHGYLKDSIDKVVTTGTSVANDKKSILQKIQIAKLQLNSKIKKLEASLIADIEGKHKEENLNIHSLEARGHSLITAIDSDRTHLDLTMKYGSEVQKLITLHKLEQNQHRYVETIDSYRENVTDVQFTFDLEETYQRLANSLKQLGRINVTRTKPDLPPCPHMKADLRRTTPVIEDTVSAGRINVTRTQSTTMSAHEGRLKANNTTN
ncbi:hypothetical protein ACJMK2_000296 [Sinanodonta woodiana]|uniref:Uncharacterized protein n=1 Tax=Sinanodonta woodiana TaxID=1069815 RepID=A0ABD3XQQ5_SINWO